jgi:hypothetical protein
MVTDRYLTVHHHATVEEFKSWCDKENLPIIGIDNLPVSKQLESVPEAEFKDFEFIIDIERKIALTLRKLDRENEADEIVRRLDAVTEVIDEA